MSSGLDIPIPAFSPEAVEAVGAYTFAYAICGVIYAVSIILWRLPGLSRTTRAAAKSACISSLISIALLTSLLSAEWMISTLNNHLGVPDWRSTLQPIKDILVTSDWIIKIVQAMLVPFLVATALLGVIATVFAPLMLIVNLIHGLFAHFAYFLMFLTTIAVAAIMLAKLVGIIAGFASVAHYFVAGGVALFPIPWTRRIGISLIIFGLVLFYGLPFMFGLMNPAPPPDAPPEELARANLLKSLNKETTPVNLIIASEYGGLLPWAYLEMNSSVEYKAPLESDPSKLPQGSTYIGEVSYKDPITGEDTTSQLWRYDFTYSRIYNGSYPLALEVLQDPLFMNPRLVPFSALLQYVVAERSLFARTMLYKHSEITTLWYQGYVLNVTQREITIEGGIDLERPDPDLRNVNSTQEYYDKIYRKAPIYVVVAKNVDSLNSNSTAYVFYSPEVYLKDPVNKIERLGKGEYMYKFRLNRASYHCWVSRTENRTDPETNSSYLVYFYKARATYEGISDELFSSSINGAPVNAEITYFKAADSWREGYKPELIISESSPGMVVSRGLALDFRPLKLVPQYQIQEEFGGIGKKQIEAAREGGYLPGRVVGGADGLFTHIIDKPREVELNPQPEVKSYRIKGTAVREAGEKEGSCPGLPGYIDVEAKVKFSSSSTPAWSYISQMEWEPMTKWGEKAYHTLYEIDPKHNLTAVAPPNVYGAPLNQITSGMFSDMKATASGTPLIGPYAVKILSYVEELVKWAFAIMMPLIFADALCALLGGVSIAGGMMSMLKQTAGSLMTSVFLFKGTRAMPSINKFYKLIRQKQDEALIANIEQLKMRGALSALGKSYANIAEKAYVEAQSKPLISFRRTTKSILGGRVKVPWIEMYSPRAEAMEEFRQAASRIAPEMATLAQKLNHPRMIEVTSKEARQILAKLPPALMYTKEGKELFLAAINVKDRVKVPETWAKGDITLHPTTAMNLATRANPFYDLVMEMFAPKEAKALARKAEDYRFERETSFAVNLDYFSVKKVVRSADSQSSSLSAGASTALDSRTAADEKSVMLLRHTATIEYSRGDYHVHIHTSDMFTEKGRVEGGGRIFEFDLPRDHKVEITGSPDEWSRAEADVIGTVRAADVKTSEGYDVHLGSEDVEKVRELLERTHHEGYDWYWVDGPALDSAEREPPAELYGEKPADSSGISDFLNDAKEVAEPSAEAIRDRFQEGVNHAIESNDTSRLEQEAGASGGEERAPDQPPVGDLIDYATDAHAPQDHRGPEGPRMTRTGGEDVEWR